MSNHFILFIPSIISLFERAYSLNEVIHITTNKLEYCFLNQEEIEMIRKLDQIVIRA